MPRVALRIALAVVAVVGVIGLLGGGLAYAMFRHFSPAPPRADFPKPANDREAQRQDLSYFRELLALDRSFAPPARKEAEQRIAALESLTTPLDPDHFRVALMKIVALADNGHTRIDASKSRQLPVRVAVFSDGLYVMRATPAYSALLGGRIVALDGTPIEVVLQRLAALRGGTAEWRKQWAAFYMVDQGILFGDDIARNPQRSEWTVVTTTGAETTALLESAPPRDEPFIFTKRWVSSEPVPGMAGDWLAQQPDQPLPLTWRDFDTAFRRVRLPNSCAMLIQIKSNNDVGSQHITDFLAATKTDMRSNLPCAAVVDLRYDDGGDYLKTAAFAKELPHLIQPGGHIYVLTGPATFSAGITTVGFIKQAAGDRVTILGEPVGDRLHFFSEGNRGCLPNSPLCVSYQRGKHDYAQPCDDWDVCFWLNKLYPVRVRTLEPDETIPTTFSQWRQGLDPVFERAVHK
jgi:hypothetical protein